MNTFILIGIIILGYWIIKRLKEKDKRGLSNRKASMTGASWMPTEAQKLSKEFHVKQVLLVSSEQALFYEIKKQLPEGYYIFPNMRVADIVTTNHGNGYYKRRNKILPTHIDFVIADRHFKPVMAIELNGTSHNGYRQEQSDNIKKEIFENAGLPIETIRVGERYDEVISMLFSKLVQKV